jgi:hypothetical protein
MKKEITIILLVFCLVMLGYGIIRYIETKQAIELIKTSSSEIKKAFEPMRIIRPKQWRQDKVWVNGKTLEECMKNKKFIDNNTVNCRNGYYKEIKVWK